MRIALSPINPTVGDLEHNARLCAEAIAAARDNNADLVILPELAISGYPPRDLLLIEGFVDACAAQAKLLGESATEDITAVFGCPLPSDLRPNGIANALLVYSNNTFVDYYDKRLLPTYDVFDENRYFTPGNRAVVFNCAGTKVGLSICEDLWKGDDTGFGDTYHNQPDPVAELAKAGAQLIVNPSASPFALGKSQRHLDQMIAHAKHHNISVATVNQLGGNDELIFHGQANYVAPNGECLNSSSPFSGETILIDSDNTIKPSPVEPAPNEELLFWALTLGVRDYLSKTGFSNAIIGLSGGIDSAVTAAIAAAAIGPQAVTGIAMPGKYSSQHSIDDAADLARKLNIAFHTTPIAEPFDGFRAAVDPLFSELNQPKLGDSLPDLTEQNLQSRARGTLMMTISNRTGAILLTTGNKSEIAVGYSTLYGDMNGGLAVLSDVPKTLVYTLANWINQNYKLAGFACPPIPESTITKPPSAELAPDQLDQDSLPPYEVLDEIIDRYVERRQSLARIAKETGFDRDLIDRIAALIMRNEYKRKQLATGLKVTHVAFGQGWRMPIAQHWRER